MFYFMSKDVFFFFASRKSPRRGYSNARFHYQSYSRNSFSLDKIQQARNVTRNRFGYLKINHLHNEDSRRLIYSPAPEKVNFSDDNEMHFRMIAIDSVISQSGNKVSCLESLTTLPWLFSRLKTAWREISIFKCYEIVFLLFPTFI